MIRKTTKRARSRKGRRRPAEELAAEHRFDYAKSRPNRFARHMDQGAVAVVLDSDVARLACARRGPVTGSVGQLVGARMATKKTAKKGSVSKSGKKEVDEFMRRLDHPLKPGLEAVRSIILGVSPAITEGIKWNSPSFCLKEWFATINIRKDVVHVILHLGAKVKDNSTAGLTIDDPTGLLEWLAKDRAAIKFPDTKAIKSARPAFERIVRQWTTYLA